MKIKRVMLHVFASSSFKGVQFHTQTQTVLFAMLDVSNKNALNNATQLLIYILKRTVRSNFQLLFNFFSRSISRKKRVLVLFSS